MKARIQGKEDRLPTSLMHKSGLRQFCDVVKVPTPIEYAKFDTPGDIDLDKLPEEFVLKPAYASAGEGVMLLTRVDGGYFDSMSQRTLTGDEIRLTQGKIYDKYVKTNSRHTIAEQRVICSEGLSIPPDYKFLAFQGRIGVIIRIDRSAGRLKMNYYDENFVPVVDERIKFNPKIADREFALPPKNWRSLLDLAVRTSYAVPTPFSRIDLFLDKESGPLLGEVTLTPGSFYYEAGHTLSLDENLRFGELWEQAARRLRMSMPVVE